MREILFRGKRADNGEWIYGNLLVDYPCCKNGVDETVKLYSILDFKTNEEEVKKVEVIPSTVGQYTDLTDKDGKKIFDGHIIRNLKTKETAVVQWFPEHSAFMVWCKSSNEVGFLYECTKSNIEVIGNIHDNPELLEQEG